MPDFEVVFTGICAYVPLSVSGTITEVCILMVNGHEVDTGAGYNKLEVESRFKSPNLVRHRSMLKFPLSSALGMPPSEMLVDLHRKRVFIEPDVTSGGPPNVSGMTPTGSGAKQGLFEMNEVLKTGSAFVAAKVRPNCLLRAPYSVDDAVSCQVFIKEGVFTTGLQASEVWNLEDPFPPDKAYEALPHSEVRCRFAGANSVNLTIESMDTVKRWVLPVAGSLQLLNLCDINPLRWPRNLKVTEAMDPDFLWYYEILDANAEAWVKAQRPSGILPFPKAKSGSNGNGENCRPAAFQVHGT